MGSISVLTPFRIFHEALLTSTGCLQFFSRLADLLASYKDRDHGSVFLEQKKCTHLNEAALGPCAKYNDGTAQQDTLLTRQCNGLLDSFVRGRKNG